MLTLEQRRALKLSASRGDVHATQALWNSIEDSRVSFVGQLHLSTSSNRPNRPKARARWSSDDLLRLPARVISSVSEPLARYPLPRRRALLGGAAAHLGGGRPASVSSSIEGAGGRLAMERRVPDGFSQPRRTEHELQSAPSLAGELGWNANEVVNESMFSASVTGLSLSRLTLETRPSARASQHSPSPFANARPPSRGLRQRALWSGGASTRSSLDSNASSYQPSAMALINPSRRDIATGMAMPVEPPCFAPEEVVLGPADCVALDDETLPPGARSERLAALASPSMIRAWSAPAARGQPTAAEQHEVQTSLEVEQTLAELRRQRLGYEQAGRYMEADAVRRRAEDVAIADSARKRDALVVRQVSEQVAAEDAYALEHAILSNRWEAKMEHFERQAAAVADALARRHERELQDLSSSLANKPAARSRPSTAQSPSHKEGPSHKGERYAGKGSADPSKELETPLAQASRHLTARQRAEVAASEQRVLGSRRNHSHRRELDFANVQKRFANILAELATQQRAEQVRLERVEKLHTIRFELAASKAASGAPPRRLAKPREASDVIVTSTVRVQPSL